MKLSRRTNTIILWVISIGLLVGMVITFTPSLGNLGSGLADGGQPALIVNGETISDIEVARVRQNPLFSSVTEGQVGEDLELLLVNQLIRQELLDQAAARTRVSGREVRQRVDEFRESQGVAGRRNDQAYKQLIGQAGFTDQQFRDYIEEQLRRQKYEENLIEDVEVTDAEVETFYLANRDLYQSEERIVARAIVVDDAELAEELRQRVRAGESFAELAGEYSEEWADRGGALGAPQGSSEPEPVGRAALPQAVSSAAFSLRGPGLTDVIESGGRFYLVQVEEFVPESPRPFEEVADQVREDALAAKQAGVVQQHIEELRQEAQITIPEGSELEYEDYPVARVGDEEIMASELALATYSSQQIQQNLNPQLAPLIVEFFKPTILENLIEQKLAYLGAQQLDADFVGSEALVAQQARDYVSRDATVEEERVQEFYEANTGRYVVPAQADVTRVEFESQETAESFRASVLEGTEVEAAAEEQGGSITDLGTVREGQLEEALDRALFATDAFEPLPGSELEVSDVLVLETEVPAKESTEETAEETTEETAEEPGDAAGEEGEEAAAEEPQTEETFVVLVAERTPERVRPLAEVREQVEQAVLAQERAQIESEWLDGLREEIEVENLLAQAREEAAAANESSEQDAAEEAPAEADTEPAQEGEATEATEGQ
ncbi:MAG TPA: peptidyl-prolyl cis-trans isomerase [Trueperaceae bacterium]